MPRQHVDPLKWPGEDRQEHGQRASAEGTAARINAPMVGVDRKTVERDVRGGTNVPPEPDAPRLDPAPIITGRDGETSGGKGG